MVARNWDWFDDALRHPEGRAVGGEPCVVCGQPILAGCNWKWRDRHACSSRCNTSLRRRLNRQIATGKVMQPAPERPSVNRLWPGMFATDVTAAFPFGYAGNSPAVGDTVERYGSITTYHEYCDETGAVDPTKVMCVHAQTGTAAVVAVSATGDMANTVLWGIYRPDVGFTGWIEGRTFVAGGIEWCWYQEIIRAVDDLGKPYTWTAIVCSPTPTETLWSPEYVELSQRLNRISVSTARHVRRQRIERTSVDRIDPLEVFEADRWTCQLCRQAIDRQAIAPHPRSVSLDHIIPLAANGTHTRGNVQTAHLSCNIRKGARMFADPNEPTAYGSGAIRS